MNLILDTVFSTSTSTESDSSCDGIDVYPDIIDNAVASTGLCDATEVLRTVDNVTLCNNMAPAGFTGINTIFSVKGKEIVFLQILKDSVHILGVVLNFL